MKSPITTEIFIEKAMNIHADKYDYSKVDYINNHTKVKITCHIHGDFLQTPLSHTQNKSGCPYCVKKKSTWSTETFIKKLKDKFGSSLSYSVIGEYTGGQNTILISDKYGECRVTASGLLMGVVPTIQTAIDKNSYFKNKAIEIHGDKYDYSKINYINSNKKISILCKKHGVFEQSAGSHLQGVGCPACALEKNIELKKIRFNDKFKELANTVHNYKYEYISSDVSKHKEKISILCKKHGVFEQSAGSHLQGVGCPACALEKSSERLQKNPIGWDYVNWKKAGERSKNFDSFKVYIIRCWNEEEEFYKIGKTFTTIENRFRSHMPYKYTIIKEIISDADTTSKLELILKNCNKENKYIPKNKFGGMYECFSGLDLTCLKDFLYLWN